MMGKMWLILAKKKWEQIIDSNRQSEKVESVRKIRMLLLKLERL